MAIKRRGQTVAYVVSRERFDPVLEAKGLLCNFELSRTLRAYAAVKRRWTKREEAPQ